MFYKADQVHRIAAKPGDIVVVDLEGFGPIEVALGPDDRHAPEAAFRVLVWDAPLEVVASNNGIPDRFFYEFRKSDRPTSP